ncbi:hypothetical protein ACFOZ0_18170 [Streptomyces yaanensis]|uniref:Uncharacterized protein n=1 Tax=Streptomyces yaanensis TaxID=1142239 RepID=A0ABV7SFK8_9ACTN|nr:hypothetical protein [Streptomyces sp. CGMCC 4.7035]WNB99346.1 hypothetical protein Q2K21_15385 [Streptomyces sp. CGMCC 4.7035]
MTDKSTTRSRAASTVRPWQSLASLGVSESDLTSTRFQPAPTPFETDGRPGRTRRHGRREEA